MLQDEVTGLPHVHQFVDQLAVLVHFHVGLRDEVLVLFPRRQIERIRNEVRALLLLVLQLLVFVFDVLAFDVLTDFELRIAGRQMIGHVVDDAAVLHLAIRTLDESEFIDARIAAQRRDQTDVRTFRRFNRTDAAVVRRMDVAHFESGALTRQTTRSKRRKTPLVGDFRQAGSSDP